MAEPLRPMSTGQLLDHTFTLYRRHFLLFVGIATVGPVAGVIFKLIAVSFRTAHSAARHAASPYARLGMPLFIGWMILLAGMAITHAGTVKAVAAVHLGQRISIAGAYAAVRGRLLRVVSVFFLATLISGAVAALIAGLAAFVLIFVSELAGPGSMAGQWGFGAGIAAVIGTAIIFLAMYIRYALAIQACVVEGLGIRESLRRSVDLSKGSRWRTAVIYTVFLLLSWIANYGLQYVALKTGVLLHNRIAATVLLYTAGLISGSIAGPLVTIGISLLYYDERIRKEAFDLQLMLASLEVPPVPMAVPAEV